MMPEIIVVVAQARAEEEKKHGTDDVRRVFNAVKYYGLLIEQQFGKLMSKQKRHHFGATVGKFRTTHANVKANLRRRFQNNYCIPQEMR
jgi:hypothetical protein